MEVKPGYKQTEVGVIPTDWNVTTAAQVCELVVDCKNRTPPVVEGGEFAVVRTPNVRNGKFIREELRFTDKSSFREWTIRAIPQVGDVLITREAPLGEVCLVPSDVRVCLGQRMMLYRPDHRAAESLFLLYALMSSGVQNNLLKKIGGSTVGHAKVDDIRDLQIPLPSTKAEQKAIAEAMSDADAHLESLEQLIAKKRHLKQGAMQQLLTGKKRLPGFVAKTDYKQTEVGLIPEDWRVETLQQLTDCLDNLRIPLNETERLKRSGDIPYCGANGVLDYIDDFVIDDDIILMAEDGGYFDEYVTRPIAYRMTGKCWVNNHAHILKAKSGVDQGFIYYSLVHKNILRFLASGTRAKLNRSELNKIEIPFPPATAEQEAIATILSDMEGEIAALEAKLAKVRQLKQGMMQELLTGKTRLI
jgi:type I restriction enzyme S subunit